MSDFERIKYEEDLLRNVLEFNKHITQAREEKVVAGRSEYFIHLKSGSEDMFAPAKFSYIKDISVERYVKIKKEQEEKKDNRFDGTEAQEHIKKEITKSKEWTPFNKLTSSAQESFKKWIKPFVPGKNLKITSFVTIFDERNFGGV